MTRSTIKDWRVESIFRDLLLKGIRIDSNQWLKSKYRDFQEKEDQGMRTYPIYHVDVQTNKAEMHGEFQYIPDPTQEGPSCSMLEQVVRGRKGKEMEEDG